MHEDVLIKLLREKEQSAFEYLIDQYKPIIEKFVFQYGVDPKRISEVVKEVFIRIAYKLDRFEQGPLSIFIYQLMIHTLKDDDRRQKKVQKVYGINNDSSQYGYFFEKQDHISNQIYLREMNSKYKLPLIFHHFYGKKSNELSTILKTNEEELSKRIQQGEKILKAKYEKEVTPHQEKSLHDNLGEMKYVYERLPEFTDKQEIMSRIDQARKSQKWKKLLPTFGAVIGLFLFATLGLNYIQEQKVMELKAAQEEKEAAKREATEVVAITEPEEYEIDPEIINYLEQAIENFSIEIGLDDVSSFPVVTSARSMIEELKRSPEMHGGVDDTKFYIDWLLTPPSTVIEKLESPSIASPDSFLEVLHVSYMYEMEFQNYLDKLISTISVDDYETIVELQDSPEKYTGPVELKKILQILNEQGYLINRDPEYGYLTVKLDYEELKDKLVNKGYGEAYLSYVDYTVNQYAIDWSDWKELKSNLLDVEVLINQYSDEYDEEFLGYLYNDLVNNLNQYLGIWNGQEKVGEEEKEEYYRFLEDNPDSIYWNIIKDTLLEWEENDWKRKQDYIAFNQVKFLFDDKYKNVKYEDIVERNRWPIMDNTGVIYKEYSSSLDSNLLVEMDPLETVSLFAYAFDKEDVSTYTLLVTSEKPSEELQDKWSKIRNSTGFVLTEYTAENTAILYFTDWEGDLLTSLDLIKENSIWKISQ
ncbi:RNA polymerase sigma factor [Paucisalibacillus globulus]|uniref:RNA polymerase sigma factor n=1 Tax=Paucisalibacillus globulus TaxID=351095 RepID=UPI0003F58C60|nr:sigma-70 family RNA polymerase sigma factor [Paucisalibacillus globulus]